MANVNNPHGLRPLMRSLSGGEINIQQFPKVVGYGTALFINDAVNRVADNSIEGSATPGTTLYSGVNLNYAAASKASLHQVIVNPDAIFEAQVNGSGIAAADLGFNANLILGAGSAVTQLSGHQINDATEAVTASLDVHLLALLNVPDNEWASAYPRVEVIFNKHRMNPVAVGV